MNDIKRDTFTQKFGSLLTAFSASARQRAEIDRLEQKLQAANDEIAQLKAEIAAVDAVMARRPALDKPTSAKNIEYAIRTAAKADGLERALAAERQRCRKEEVGPLMTAIQHEIDWHMEAAEQATDQGLRVNSQSKPFAEACFKDAAVYTGRARLLENVIAAVRAVQEAKP